MKKSIDFENIPAGWTAHELGELLERIANGLTLKQEVLPPGIPVSRIETISDGTINFERVRYVRKIEGSKKQNFLLQQGDILFSHINSDLHLGKTAIFSSSKPLLHGMNLLLLRTKKEILDPYYLHYLLNYYRKEGKFIEVAQHAVNQSSLNQKKIKSFQIPLAPPEQQKDIVAEIEKQFSRLDEAVANLKRVRANLKRYKAAVLKAAVEGKLTEEWRKEHPDVEPASKLLERILNERRKKWEEAELAKMKAKGKVPKDDTWKKKYKEPQKPDINNLQNIPKSWSWYKTDQLFCFVTSGSRGWAKYYSDKGAIFLRVGNLDHDSVQLDLSNIQRVSLPEGTEGIRTLVENNDILVSITADVGMIAVVPLDLGEAYINQHISLARPISSINAIYLAWFLTSRTGQKQFQDLQRGATKAGLGLDDIRSVNVPVPSLLEQEQIVSEIENKLSVIETLDRELTINFKRAERLRQSILHKAFSGKLLQAAPAGLKK